MIEVSQIEKCKRMWSEGVSIREISRMTDISRNTIRRYLRGEAIPGEPKPRRRSRPVSDRILPRVRKLIEDEVRKETPRKQKLTGSRIHRILQQEGYQASAVTVRRVVREVRRKIDDLLKNAFVPLAYDPGVDAQVDFFEGEYDHPEQGRRKCYFLLVRACYSGRTFVYAAPNQTREALLEGLIQAFEHFGGVFKHLWFDNLTPAVRKVLKGSKREEQKAFTSFKVHYGFEAEFCSPGKGNEKGGVEGGVKYVRSEILSPIPTVQGREHLQRICDDFMREELDRTMEGKADSIQAHWRIEVPRLLPLPAVRYDASKVRIAKVTKRSWIQYGTCFYSVPVDQVGLEVILRVGAEEVVIYSKDKEVARHRRCHDKYQAILDIQHYVPLLLRKSRGVDRAIPVRQWLEKVSPSWTELLRRLRSNQGEIDGSKSFIEIVSLCKIHDAESVTNAIDRALKEVGVSLPTIRFFLGLAKEEEDQLPPRIDYAGPSVSQSSAGEYMVLFFDREAARA